MALAMGMGVVVCVVWIGCRGRVWVSAVRVELALSVMKPVGACGIGVMRPGGYTVSVTAMPDRANTREEGALDRGLDSAAFLERLRANDGAAYERLVREASPRLLATARRLMGNEADAREALQDGFVSAFKGIGGFDGHSMLTTWLHRVVVNACLMKLRAKRRRPERSIEGMLPGFVEDGHQARASVSWGGGAGDAMERAEVRELVRSSIAMLPESYRVVLMLRDIEGLDTASTGVMLGLSESAVKTRLHRARQALRELLDPRLREEGTGS